MSLFYSLIFLVLGIGYLPFWMLKKKHWPSFKNKLGFSLPKIQRKDRLIWIHAVSVGETKMIAPIYERLRQESENTSIIISTTTSTGLEQAKKSLKGADAYFFLPFDFAPCIKRATARYNPDLFLLCESDYWFELLHQLKKGETEILLINGKMSDQSAKTYKKCLSFSKRLFSFFNHLFVQTQADEAKFRALGVSQAKITVTGNVKFDANLPAPVDWEAGEYLTIGSTHEGEEKRILEQLPILWDNYPHLQVFLAPRHPERVSAVEELLKARRIDYSLFSSQKNAKLILVDQMGILPSLYSLSKAAIVGGSFVPGIGGHNIFEPIQAHIPVLFGPFMDSQQEMVEKVLENGAGLQCPAQEIASHLTRLFQEEASFCAQAESLDQLSRGATGKIWPRLAKFLSIMPETVKL